MPQPSTLPVQLDRTLVTPLTAQLTTQVRRLIVAGSLRLGDRLPSSRSLAADLLVSRAVTEQTYAQLLAEGWIQTRHGAGTYVASGGLAATPTPPVRRRPSTPTFVSLDAGTPWIDPRHAAGWRRAWREVSSTRPPRGYDDPRGIPELRAALADRVARTRGLSVDPEEIVVTSGTTDGLRHMVSVLLPGAVALEDPGYRAAVETVRGLGRRVVDLPAGTQTERSDLVRLGGAEQVVAVGVTPAHQHPLGLVMPASDRLRLLDAARATGAVVLEDDYDSEFRYDVAPVPALASLDRSVVAYLGTTSKSVAPSLRLGWLVPPPHLLEAVTRRRELTHDAPSWPAQRALVSLLRDGYVDAVVRTARRVYAERAPRVQAALAPYAETAAPPAGMYTTWLMPQADALRARAHARRAGFEVNLLSDYCRSARLTGLVVGFGGVTDDELDRALAALVAGLGG